ncbi:ABC transporter ATP-binding protein [Aliidiomarina sanyensis]|uniref:ABC transporter ATP-binding protein n=1 Tax=Aliidiomarina sanyensis TaxID=1249555 RepID=A0A432WS99_9GAMM|nr:ABC transporter ATP-binding protein [Aliidiomarina sanyensis]RUO36642.1 ABC transporter ATP-binding protein [Aliidiomarina sanyensis]
MRESVIEIRGLRNQFGHHVVHDQLDLTLPRGEILGVVGGSGAGKSVLLRSIVGLQKPASGHIEVLGIDVQKASSRERLALERRTGVLFQSGALFSSMTVVENVAMPLIEHEHLRKSDALELARMKLALVGLPGHAGDLQPAELSGGMVKRAALARSLALEPELLFLDEPTAGLDPIGAAAFDELIVTLRDALGLTVFLVTHDLDTLYQACDRIAVIGEKKILIHDTLSQVASFDHPWVHDYFHGPRGRQAAAVGQQRRSL